MRIDYTNTQNYNFYDTEINEALDWLYRIMDVENHGWAWVQFIKPNEQNTAEVICAYAECEYWLNNNLDKIDSLVESIEYWLLDTSHAKISIDFCWVLKALQKVRECELLYSKLDENKVKKAIDECLQWLCSSYKNMEGWGDNESEKSNVIRTALAIMGLNEEIQFIEKNNLKDNIQNYKSVVNSAIKWLIQIQNRDGGWGNLDAKLVDQKYQTSHNFTYSDLLYQCESNAASTGYVMLALLSDKNNLYESELKRAYGYLKTIQMDNGGWQTFTEIGIRDGQRYTFRHFGTAWALQGIINSKLADYRDECIIHGFEYLSNLQDENYGGWKSSPDADNYTWATCNAISTINLLKKDLSEVYAKYFLGVVWDWWTLKKKDANYSFEIGQFKFAFNGAMALIFCITFSIMITLSLTNILKMFEPLFIMETETIRKFIYSVVTVLAAFILGLPWIVYVKNRFRQEVSGWIDSIGWVYGIITGFVLVLYQYIL